MGTAGILSLIPGTAISIFSICKILKKGVKLYLCLCIRVYKKYKKAKNIKKKVTYYDYKKVIDNQSDRRNRIKL